MKIMENKKKKNPVTIMLVISLIVMILGVACGAAVYYEISNQIAAQSGGGVYIDGADFSGIVELMGQAGAFVLSALIIFASFFAVAIQWITYFIIKAIRNHSAKKNQQQQMYMRNDNMM